MVLKGDDAVMVGDFGHDKYHRDKKVPIFKVRALITSTV